MSDVMRRTPLRVKLIAAVLSLVTAALLVIGLSVVYEMRSYLGDQIDQQLNDAIAPLAANPITVIQAEQYPTQNADFRLDWFVTVKDTMGNGGVIRNITYSAADLPPFPRTVGAIDAVIGKPYTVRSINGKYTWRCVAERIGNGDVLYVGQTLTAVQASVRRLVIIELLAGGIVLIVLSGIGAAMIRGSLRPLGQIEETAAAIAAGDLTRRVPEFEPVAEPRTEVGRVGRAFNTMVAQIESAFAARTASEESARGAAETAHRAALAAQQSEAKAVRSEERMRQFAADASHELRTPLTTIRGFAELFRQQGAAASPDEAAKIMRRIEGEAIRMGLLVDDLLLLARLDQQRPLEEAPVDLRIIGGDAVDNARAMAPQRPVELEIADGAGSLVVIGDELRLRQVVTNLMTNALTYTPPDSPIVVRLDRSPRPGFVELSVIDSGPGLTREQMGHIFERFYRADDARTRRGQSALSSGTGLGLAIVAAIVAAHGGTVDVDSADPRHPGATFRVTLRAAPRDEDIE